MPRGRLYRGEMRLVVGSQRGLCWQLGLNPSRSLVASRSVLSAVSGSVRPCGLSPTRPESWSGLPCPPPGGRLHPGTEPASLRSPALAALPGKPLASFFISFTSLKWARGRLASCFYAFPASLHIVSVLTAKPLPLRQASGNLARGTNPAVLFPFFLLWFFVIPLLFPFFFFLVRIDLQYCVSFSYTDVYIQILFRYRLVQILYEFPTLFSESFLFTCFIHSSINLLIQYCYFVPSSSLFPW